MKSMKTYLTLVAATLMAAACATTDYDRYDTWDMDNDARISLSEFNEGYSTLGVDFDENNDGFYDQAEFAEGVFGWNDLDNDGMWDRDEYIRANTAFGNDFGPFEEYDQNRDMTIDNDEFAEGLNRTTVFDTWDANRGGSLDDFEVRTGMFGTADLDNDGFIDDDEWDDWHMTL